MVSLAEQLERTKFHDAELARCVSDGSTLCLHFRNISLRDGKEEYYSAHVVLRGVQKIQCNGTPIPELKLEGEGSDVLQFHRGDGKALLLIEWQSYRQNSFVFAKYEIDYGSSDLTFEKQDELIV